jgi:CubicO group peptidase (beta-lactamase class C family)
MKKFILILGLLLLVLVVITILYIAHGKQLNEAYIKRLIKNAQKKFNIPAVAVNIMDSNQILYSVYDGVRVTGTSDSITSEDYFHIGSTGKIILACIAANLVDENMINWDTKFFNLFPEMKKEAKEDYYDITLEDLLSWRAGIQPYISGETEVFPELPKEGDQKLAFAKYLLQLEPFSKRDNSGKFEYLYSNASYSVACLMLEKVSDLTYEELLDKYICKKLGVDIFIGWPYQKDRNQPWGHYSLDNKTLEIVGPDSDYALHPVINAAGNLSMKSQDFAKFVQYYLKLMSGTNTGVSSKTVQYIHSKLLGSDTWHGKTYTCFDGSAGTFYARGFLVPELDFACTVIINSGNPDAVEYITTQLVKAKNKTW